MRKIFILAVVCAAIFAAVPAAAQVTRGPNRPNFETDCPSGYFAAPYTTGYDTATGLFVQTICLSSASIPVLWNGTNYQSVILSTTTFPLLAPNGTAAAPSYSFTNGATAGLYLTAGGDPAIAQSGTEIAAFDSGNGFLAAGVYFDLNGKTRLTTVFDPNNSVASLVQSVGLTLGLPQVAGDPTTTGWGATQDGRLWINTTGHTLDYWSNGAVHSVAAATGQTNATVAYSTASATTTGSITATTMVTAGASGNKYQFNATAIQTAVGVSCTSNTTLALSLTYTDAVTGAPAISPNLAGSSTGSVALSASPPIAVSNGVIGTLVQWIPVAINAAASTTVQYAVTRTAGAGCTTFPSYYILPELVQVQ